MAVTVHLPDPLQKFAQNQESVQVKLADGSSIINLIEHLDEMYRGIRSKLLKNGEIREYVKIFLNEEDISFINGNETFISDGDSVTIVAAIAGG